MEGAFSPEHNPNEAGPNSEALPIIERAKRTYAELQQYDNVVVGRETYHTVEELAAALSQDLRQLSWRERVDNGLPWNPRDEMQRGNELDN